MRGRVPSRPGGARAARLGNLDRRGHAYPDQEDPRTRSGGSRNRSVSARLCFDRRGRSGAASDRRSRSRRPGHPRRSPFRRSRRPCDGRQGPARSGRGRRIADPESERLLGARSASRCVMVVSPLGERDEEESRMLPNRRGNVMRKGILFAVAALLALSSATAFGAVFSASGPDPASIQPTVDAFRTALGAINANVAGSFPGGRREINWDGVPDSFSAPNNLPANFFNVNSPRGVVFSTPGSGFQVSADNSNPTTTPIEFDNVNLTYSTTFTTFSAQRLFTAVGSNVTDVTFFVPGSTTPATTNGFGVIFTDVDGAAAASIQLFDAAGTSLGIFFAPSANNGLGFVGVTAGERVGRVRITSGNSALGPNDAPPGVDVVVMDDFIYGEPIALGALVRQACGATAANIQATVDQFRTDLGALNANVAGSFPSGRREINWDGVPDSFSAPNNLPANFFNVNSPRGVVFSTPGTGFQVSADTDNPTTTPVEFGNLNPTYPATFTTFSAQRLFTALGSNITDVNFFVAGSTTPATTRGFGAVFTDVDVASGTSIEYFDAQGTSLGTFLIGSTSSGGVCFLGVSFGAAIVGRVRITSGNTAPGPDDAPTAVDVVVMDDFIYGEPQGAGVTPTPIPTLTATATATPTTSPPTLTPTPTTVPPTFTPTAIGGGGPAPGSIPTLSPGMLALLGLALAVVSVLLIRRS